MKAGPRVGKACERNHNLLGSAAVNRKIPFGGVPEDHEKSGRKAEKREKAEIVQTAPFGCAEGGSGCRKSLSLRASPQTGAAICYLRRGELEGAKPASNKIKCRAKPCLARRAWSTPRVLASRREATIFVPQGGTKITTLFQAVEKAGGFFDSLERTAQAVLLLYVKGKLLYFWRCWPHTCGQEVML